MISKNKLKLIRSLATKKGRLAEGLFVAEGPKVVGDLVAAGFEAEEIIDDEADVKRASFLQHPQGVMGIFHLPRWAAGDDPLEMQADDLVVALDGVQDPGNVGTIIRLADWFGVGRIVCSHATADCWSPKVVQATMGSIARTRVVYTDLNRFFERLPEDVPVYGTLLDGNDIYHEQLSRGGVIVMGNEGNGISSDIRQRVSHRLLIPNYPPDRPTADSLNVAVATAIVLSEFRRRE